MDVGLLIIGRRRIGPECGIVRIAGSHTHYIAEKSCERFDLSCN
jgi:hypothetical protein